MAANSHPPFSPYSAPGLYSAGRPDFRLRSSSSWNDRAVVTQESTVSSTRAQPNPTNEKARQSVISTPSKQKPSMFKRIFCCAAEEDVYQDEKRSTAQSSKASQPMSEKAPLREKIAKKAPAPMRKWIYSANTPEDQIPFKTWDEWHAAYSQRLIDVDNPPLPPKGSRRKTLEIRREQQDQSTITSEHSAEDSDAPKSVYESQNYSAPKPADEAARQLAVNRLDVWGKYGPPPQVGLRRGSLSSDAKHRGHVTEEEFSVMTNEEDLQLTKEGQYVSPTLEGHPAFKKIVSYARQAFGTKCSMITVLEEDTFVFLAESGLGMREIPRDINFCGHTLLASDKGLVALDLTKDWRFNKNPLTEHYHSRFYAGVPLFAPPMAEGEDAQPIGTLCIVDDSPRSEFSEAERRKLQRLGELARKEVANWHKLRMAEKTRLMQKQLSNFHSKAEVAKTRRTSGRRVMAVRPAQKQVSPGTNSTLDSLPDNIPFPAAVSKSPAVGHEQSYWEMSDPEAEEAEDATVSDIDLSGDESVAPSLGKQNASTFNLATRMIAKTLALPLVYLITLNLEGEQVASMDLLASHGLPNPAPTFDANLHYKVLTAPEGGLLYQNPAAQDLGDAKFPSNAENVVYASAILVSVARINNRGYVLAGFARDPRRVFGLEDWDYLREMREELIFFCEKDSRRE